MGEEVNSITVHDGPIIKHVLVQGEKANKAMDELLEELGFTEFYSTPTIKV